MRNLSLLVIEPDGVTRAAIVGVLRGHFGSECVAQASSLARAVGDSHLAGYDLVLTNWELPDGTGGELMERLRYHRARGVVVVAGANCHASATLAIVHGATDYLVRRGDYLETLALSVEKNLAFVRLRRERDVLHRQLLEQNETLNQLLKNLEEAAATDPLTNLYNRGHLARLLEQMFDDAQRGRHDLSCLMLDMDRFKQLNDTLGHQAGDEALITLSKVIRESMRKMDAAARYGGDEFVVLLPRTDPLEASRVAKRIRQAYEQEMAVVAPRSHAFMPLGISFGIASLHNDNAKSGDALIAAADAALYRAKRQGRDRVHLSAPRPATRAG